MWVVTLSYGQAVDSLEHALRVDTTQIGAVRTAPTKGSILDDTDDFTPMLGMFALVALGFALFCIGAGVVLIGALLCILFGLVAAGVLSASLLVGLKTRSVTATAKTLWVLGSTTTSLLVGAVALGILDRVGALAVSTGMAMLLGALSGAVVGFVVAQVAWWAGKWLLRHAQNQVMSAS